MKIGVVGSRRRNTIKDYQLIEFELTKILKNKNEEFQIISGGCPKGADRFAEQLAEKYKLKIIIHKAEWDKYGKLAGFKRNTYIATDSDILIACVAEDRKGGTEDTIRKYLSLNKKKLILI